MENIELWHDDDHFDSDQRQKTERGRIRLTRQYMAALRRNSTSPALLLAEKLDACAPGARCRSGACPQCGRAEARRLAQKAEYAFSDCEMAFVSIIPPVERS